MSKAQYDEMMGFSSPATTEERGPWTELGMTKAAYQSMMGQALDDDIMRITSIVNPRSVIRGTISQYAFGSEGKSACTTIAIEVFPLLSSLRCCCITRPSLPLSCGLLRPPCSCCRTPAPVGRHWMESFTRPQPHLSASSCPLLPCTAAGQGLLCGQGVESNRGIQSAGGVQHRSAQEAIHRWMRPGCQ